MQFIITRASAFFENSKQPIDGAELRMVDNEPYWIYTVSTLEELVKLVDSVGNSIIVSSADNPLNIPKLLIYDGYLE
jgi:hypothetical protein